MTKLQQRRMGQKRSGGECAGSELGRPASHRSRSLYIGDPSVLGYDIVSDLAHPAIV